MSNGERHLLRIVFRNLINSLKPRQTVGNKIGQDYIGNAYYEIPADPQRGKRRANRWYDPPKGQDFQDPIPAEWEAWLRLRRIEPPTEEEISRNLAVAELKKVNAAKLEEKRLAAGGALPIQVEKGAESFPSYPEYHTGHPDTNPKKG